MDFGEALALLRTGHKVARSGWNGKGMWLKLAQPEPESSWLPYIYMSTVDGSLVPWLASQTDVLGVDWELVD